MSRYLAFTFVLLFAHPHVHAADPGANPFDNQSLEGWTTKDGKPVPEAWEVVDGVMHLKKGGEKGGDIFTVRDYGDFALSFDWKIATGGNNGIKYRVRSYDKKTLGLEYQVFDDVNQKSPTKPKNSAGSIYDLYEPNADKMLKPAGEWNTAKIVVRGNHIEHWLNGKRIVTATVGSAEWRKRVAASKFHDAKQFSENRFGKIMITDHGSEVWYRNFEFTPSSMMQTASTSGGNNCCRVGRFRRIFRSRCCR